VVGVLAYESSRKPSPPAPLAAAPEPVAPVVPARPAPPVVHHAPAKAPEAKLPEASAAAEKLEVASAQAPAVDTPKAEPSAERAVAPPGTRRLVLRMEQEAWLEVRDGAGRGLVSSLNPAGTERSVRGQPPFQLVIGNAAHVRLTYNGKPVDLGPYIKDQVARLTLQ
jgi:cytoskeleton protein RodZ